MKLKASIIAVLILLAGALYFAYFWYGKHTVVIEPVVPEPVVIGKPVETIIHTATTSAAAEESIPFNHRPTITVKDSIINNGNGTNTYSSTDLGIAFEYPSWMGDKIKYAAEKSQCPKESKDPCLMIFATIWNGVAEEQFFAIKTPAHDAYYVPGRGGYWGDSSSIPIIRPFGTRCEDFPNECNTSTNKHGIEYIFELHKGIGINDDYFRWILILSLPNEYYKGMAISLEDPSNPETSESTTAVKTTLTKIAESMRVVK